MHRENFGNSIFQKRNHRTPKSGFCETRKLLLKTLPRVDDVQIGQLVFLLLLFQRCFEWMLGSRLCECGTEPNSDKIRHSRRRSVKKKLWLFNRQNSGFKRAQRSNKTKEFRSEQYRFDVVPMAMCLCVAAVLVSEYATHNGQSSGQVPLKTPTPSLSPPLLWANHNTCPTVTAPSKVLFDSYLIVPFANSSYDRIQKSGRK